MRQMREPPFGKGKPFSSETYQAPSGPTATEVGTASARNGSGSGGGGPRTSSGHGTASGLKRATVEILPRWLTSSRSLFAASVTRKRLPHSRARPNAFDSAGSVGLVVGIGVAHLVGGNVGDTVDAPPRRTRRSWPNGPPPASGAPPIVT